MEGDEKIDKLRILEEIELPSSHGVAKLARQLLDGAIGYRMCLNSAIASPILSQDADYSHYHTTMKEKWLF